MLNPRAELSMIGITGFSLLVKLPTQKKQFATLKDTVVHFVLIWRKELKLD